MKAKKVYISSGEASGDLHGSNLARALRRQDPGIQLIGMGGDRMRGAGVDVRVDIQDMGITGIVEVFVRFPRVIRAFRRVCQTLADERPDVVVLIDAPELNMRLAKQARKLGIKVIYYISPQVWAWRSHRIHTLAKIVDRMLVILPFEKDLYEKVGMDVEFVGHPLLDEPMPPAGGEALRHELGLDPSKRYVALLPGSRSNEMQHMGDLLCDTAHEIHRRLPDVQFLLPLASTIRRDFAHKVIGRARVPIQLIHNQTYKVLRTCDLAIAAAGTVTLEAALLEAPLMVIYRTSRISYFLAQMLVHVDHVSLVNMIARRRMVPEFIQDAANPEALAEHAANLLSDPAALTRMRQDLSTIRTLLGEPGASDRAAASVLEFLGPTRQPVLPEAPHPSPPRLGADFRG